jgi:hypothetical protein
LEEAPYNFTEAMSDHSGQFQGPIQSAWDFYATLIEAIGF